MQNAFLPYVSIHLMLLFINNVRCRRWVRSEFQYISCCYLSGTEHTKKGCISVSIHLMLLFIHYYNIKFLENYKFQYISCCYLSISRMYQILSGSYVSIHLMLLFIMYQKRYPIYFGIVSIHLMLLFIGGGKPKVKGGNLGFNTSHVVIYHRKRSE